MAGARSFTAIAEWVADAPPWVLAALGVRYDPLAGCFRPPDEAAIRQVLESVDAAALEAAVGSWLAARLQATRQPPPRPGQRERRAVAVDGKAVRGTRHASPEGQAVHLLAAADQQSSAVLAQAKVDGKTNEITRFAPLLAPLDLARAVVTADALHAQREHAQFLVTEKNAHYILAVKNNQPGLHAQLENLPWRQVPAGFDAPGERPRPRRMAHPQGHRRGRRDLLPARCPGHPDHPPTAAAVDGPPVSGPRRSANGGNRRRPCRIS